MHNHDSEQKLATGCYLTFFCLWGIFGVAWFCFIVWAIYKVVTWLTSQTL